MSKIPKHWIIYKVLNKTPMQVDFVIFNYKARDPKITHSIYKINHNSYMPENCNLKNLKLITNEEFILELL